MTKLKFVDIRDADSSFNDATIVAIGLASVPSVTLASTTANPAIVFAGSYFAAFDAFDIDIAPPAAAATFTASGASATLASAVTSSAVTTASIAANIAAFKPPLF